MNIKNWLSRELFSAGNAQLSSIELGLFGTTVSLSAQLLFHIFFFSAVFGERRVALEVPFSFCVAATKKFSRIAPPFLFCVLKIERSETMRWLDAQNSE